jgi:hypothetical protein
MVGRRSPAFVEPVQRVPFEVDEPEPQVTRVEAFVR